jgi:hypothetical protein
MGFQPETRGQRRKTMKSQTRFINSVVAASQADAPQLPWARGARRAAFIAKRNGIVLKNAA